MRVLITGSEGFIGTHLKERLLKEGHSVTGIDNLSHPCQFRKGKFINKSIFDITTKDVKGHDFMVHLAAQINVEESLYNPLDTVKTNVLGTLHMLELSRMTNVPLIFASTTEIYGDKQTQKIDENHVIRPKSPYAASKAGADALCLAYFYSFNTKVIMIRNFNTFGKYQSNDKFGAVIAIFAEQLFKGKSPTIFGDGTQMRDFMGYKDAIDFYMLILNGKGKFGESYNVGMGKNIDMNTLANKLCKIVNPKIKPIHIAPRPGEVKEFLCDNKKAKSIGWNPDTNFDKLLKEYIEWKVKYDS